MGALTGAKRWETRKRRPPRGRPSRGGDGDGERLLAFHHTVDCGFVLTGQGSEFDNVLPAPVDSQTNIDLSPTPWDEVLDLLRRGAHEIALARCQAIVDEQPWHRSAYVAGAMLATVLGEQHAAEELALLGSRYFPDDGLLKHLLGLARIGQGRVDEGEQALVEALRCEPGLVAARTALVVSRVQRRDFSGAAALLAARVGVRADDARADEMLDQVESWLRWRRLTVYGGLALAVLGLTTVFVTWLGLVPVACGLAASLVGLTAFDRQVEALVDRRGGDHVRRALRRLAHKRDPAQVVS